jgi:ribosomal protein S18 acetylase RimI-like enzyme
MKWVEPSADADAYLGLEYLASEPYSTFVYEDEAQARAIARFLLESACEFSAPAGRLALGDTAPVGMIACLTAEELSRARMNAAMALVRGKKIAADGPVRERMMIASDALMRLEAGDFYLSRIAVAASARRGGVGLQLMSEVERLAREAGAKRLVLEVSPSHAAAVRMYERAGLAAVDEVRVEDPESGRTLTYRHMAEAL